MPVLRVGSSRLILTPAGAARLIATPAKMLDTTDAIGRASAVIENVRQGDKGTSIKNLVGCEVGSNTIQHTRHLPLIPRLAVACGVPLLIQSVCNGLLG